MSDYRDFLFEMWRGDTEAFDGAATVDDVVVDITGCSIKFTGKRNLADSDANAVFQVTTPIDISITNGPLGLFRAVLSSSKTSGIIAPTVCFCDFQLVDTLGNVSTLATGMLTIKVDITETNT